MKTLAELLEAVRKLPALFHDRNIMWGCLTTQAGGHGRPALEISRWAAGAPIPAGRALAEWAADVRPPDEQWVQVLETIAALLEAAPRLLEAALREEARREQAWVRAPLLDGHPPINVHDGTWDRIGPVPCSGYRSTWFRVTFEDGGIAPATRHATAFEVCSGRGGEDTYVRVALDNPQFNELLDLLYCAEWSAQHCYGGHYSSMPRSVLEAVRAYGDAERAAAVDPDQDADSRSAWVRDTALDKLLAAIDETDAGIVARRALAEKVLEVAHNAEFVPMPACTDCGDYPGNLRRSRWCSTYCKECCRKNGHGCQRIEAIDKDKLAALVGPALADRIEKECRDG